jgi:hypothetical protein
MNYFFKQPLADWLKVTNRPVIAGIVRHLKSSKAAWCEKIQIITFQYLPGIVLNLISKIFNSTVSCAESFPFTMVKIIMLLKPGKDHTSQMNYRLTNLLYSLGKMFKKLLLESLDLQLRELKVARNGHYALE